MEISPAARSVTERHRPTKLATSLAQPLDAIEVPGALLKLSTVRPIVGLSSSSIYRKIAESSFPEPVRLGARCSRWRSDDIKAWLAKQAS